MWMDSSCRMEAFRSKSRSTNGPCFSKGKSNFRGVFKVGNRWRAQIKNGRNCVTLGNFEEEEEAARTYVSAALYVHKE